MSNAVGNASQSANQTKPELGQNASISDKLEKMGKVTSPRHSFINIFLLSAFSKKGIRNT